MMSDPTATISPYERLGGKAMIRRVVDRFYDLMDTEPGFVELRAMHAADLTPIRESLSGFLAGWCGGPRDWFEQNPGKCMMTAHARLDIRPSVAAQWCEAMGRALADSGVDPIVAAQLNEAFGRMAGAMAARG